MNSSNEELRDDLHLRDQLKRALCRRERQIGALRRISEGLALPGGETLIGQAMDVVLQCLGGRAAAVLLYDSLDDCLVFRCVLGPCAESLARERLPASLGLEGQVLRTGLPDITHRAAPQQSFPLLKEAGEEIGEEIGAETQTLLTVPLQRAAGDIIGVMQFLWTSAAGDDAGLDAESLDAESLDESDLEVVRVLGAGIVAALETARLTGQAQRAEIVSLIGDISHDIKNMLTPIQSGLWTLEPMLDGLFQGLETIRQQSQGRAAENDIARVAEAVHEHYGWILQSAHVACDQLAARTREIADAVKGELAAPVFEVANLNDVVGEVALPLFMLAEQTNVHLHFELDKDLPRAEFDRKQIYNALYNLVNNALPETPSGGSVTIRTQAPAPGEDTLLLEVEDTGRGIPEHVLPFLFTDQAVSTKIGGTGLGTRIVGGVVRRHQGSIAVRSQMGEGTTFSIRLPLRHRPEAEMGIGAPTPRPRRRHNLPIPATSFVGRAAERARAREMLQSGARLLTFSGAAGTGKTRLALQVAGDKVDDFEDGVWQVSLAPIDAAQRVAATIAATLGVREEPGRDLESSLADYLRPKRLLLLLDNFEQVLGAAPLVSRLLDECEGLVILVTSRALLHLRGEREVSVAPLELPTSHPLSVHLLPARVREIAQCESVALFVERAIQVRPDFALSPANARDVALICTHLDGLPLAIELAAARVKILSPGAIRSHLESHTPLPGKGPQDAPRRHQTLRAALDWSYDLLSPAEQTLLRRLMVFEGGCGVEGARVVAPTHETGLDVADGLQLLCDKSLLRSALQNDGSTWFYALQTLRGYGQEKLVASGELEWIQRRHAIHYLHLVENAEKMLVKAPGTVSLPGLPPLEASQTQWREWREREHDNVRAALHWFLTQGQELNGQKLAGTASGGEKMDGQEMDGEAASYGALRIAFALRQVWIGDLWTERREALERALESSPDAPDDMRLKAMLFAGDLAVLQTDMQRASEFGEQSLILSQKMGSGWSQARSLGILANVALETGDMARARSLHEQSLVIHRELGDLHSVPWALYFLGDVAKRAGDATVSRRYFEASLSSFRELDDKEGIALALYQVGMALYSREDPAPARALIEESLALCREIEHQTGLAWTLGFLGQMAADKRDFELAREQLEQSLEVSRRLGNRAHVRAMLQALSEIALDESDVEQARALLRELLALEGTASASSPARELLESFARLAQAQGQSERAARLLGAAGRLGAQLEASELKDSPVTGQVRVTLGEAAFNAAWQRGAALTRDEITTEMRAL